MALEDEVRDVSTSLSAIETVLDAQSELLQEIRTLLKEIEINTRTVR